MDPEGGRADAGVEPSAPVAAPVGVAGVALRRTVDAADWVEAVYEELRSEIYSFALRSARDAAAAEDVMQEAFIRLLREAREGRLPDDPRAWLYRVVSNLVISGGRRASVAQRWRSVLARRDTPQPSPEFTVIRRERRDAVQAALETLTPDARTALLLAANGFNGREIAATLGRTELATRALLCRARTQLRGRLEAADADAE